MKSAREKAVALITRQLNKQQLRKLIIFNAHNLIIYNHPARFYQQYKLTDWYLPELLNSLNQHNLTTKAVLVAYEAEYYQLLKINNEALLNDRYSVSARLVYLMTHYYRQKYAEWSAKNEGEIVKYKWQNEIDRYYHDSTYRHKLDEKINNFQNPKSPF